MGHLDPWGLKILLGITFLLFAWVFYVATNGMRALNHRDVLGDVSLLATGVAMIVIAWVLRIVEKG